MTSNAPQSSCVTTETIPGFRIIRALGTVYGVSVKSRNFVGNALGNLRATFGGEQGGFANLVSATRQEAIASMLRQADGIGANAVIGMRFDSGEFDSGEGQRNRWWLTAPPWCLNPSSEAVLVFFRLGIFNKQRGHAPLSGCKPQGDLP